MTYLRLAALALLLLLLPLPAAAQTDGNLVLTRANMVYLCGGAVAATVNCGTVSVPLSGTYTFETTDVEEDCVSFTITLQHRGRPDGDWHDLPTTLTMAVTALRNYGPLSTELRASPNSTIVGCTDLEITVEWSNK